MRLPNGLIPYPHQAEAALDIFHNRNAILAFDVGVGKTLTALVAARLYHKVTGGKVVVVCPPSLITNWQRESQDLIDPIICSSGKIPSPDDFTERFYLIADEAHYYQNISSKRTQKMLALADKADGTLLMTATPIRNYPSNIFPLLKILRHPLGDNYAAFERRYCDGKQAGSSNLVELHSRMATSLILGSKEEYLSLPIFKRIMYPVEFSGAGLIIFEATMRRMNEVYKQRVASKTISGKGWCIVLLNHLRMATALGKSIKAVQIAKKALENGHQVVIFTNFIKSARYIEYNLAESGVSALLGSTPKAQRQGLVDDFQEGESRFFVMTRAGSAGLNLQQGTIFISVDRTWSPFDMIQAEGRIHRNGQNNPCYSIWLQDAIIDPFLDRMMLNKYRVARTALSGQADEMPGVGNPGSWAESLSNFIFNFKELYK